MKICLTKTILKIHSYLCNKIGPKLMSEERKMYPIKCADCGKDSEVPFQPKEGRPVYCRECLPKHRSRDGPGRF